jgi:glutathione S-transferase
MKLFYSPGSCSLSPHIVAREAGLPLEVERVNTAAKEIASGGDYRKINPKGYVPALQLDDGRVLTEGPAIVQYLADLAPQSGLAPANGTFERYQLQEWLNFVSTELHKQYSPLFGAKTPEEWKTQLRERIAGRFDWLETILSERAYLMGEKFSVADAYLFAVVRWSPRVHVDLARWPSIQKYFERVRARPAVAAAMDAEGLK